MSPFLCTLPRGLRRLVTGATLCCAALGTAHAASLTVYGAMGYDQHVAQAFTKATGIPVNLIHLSTGPLLARVQAEARNPQWDVLWLDGNQAMQTFAAQALLQCGWSPAVRYAALGQQLVPPSHCWQPVGVTYAGVILYNPKAIAEADWPRTWEDLTRPALRGKVGMDNPAVSGPTYPLVAGLLQHFGQGPGEGYFERLKANGLKVFPTNSVTLRALQYGQIDAAVVQSSAAIGFLHEMPELRIATPAPATVLPSDLAIGKHAIGPLQQQARRFVQWVLSPAGQAAMQQGDPDADSNYEPLVDGTAALPSLKRLGTVQPLVLDPAVWGPKEPQVIDWFTAHIAR
ncbi:MAG: ABC transporter substrate-binding protein [Thiomonas sp.]